MAESEKRDLEKRELEDVGVDPIRDSESNAKPMTLQDSEEDFGFTPEEQRKILWKVDRRLVVTVGAMYW